MRVTSSLGREDGEAVVPDPEVVENAVLDRRPRCRSAESGREEGPARGSATRQRIIKSGGFYQNFATKSVYTSYSGKE